jgi:hypothetical protein
MSLRRQEQSKRNWKASGSIFGIYCKDVRAIEEMELGLFYTIYEFDRNNFGKQ